MKILSLLCVLISTGFSSTAHAEKVKILTYNTWGVPVAVWDTWRYKKAMKTIEKMNPDIVLLTEVFTTKAKLAFRSKKYPYHADGGNWVPRLVGSGLRILSKFPIQKHAILTYSNCKKDDCLSRKGANLIIAKLPSGKSINFVGTHLNAAGGEETRISQLKQLQIFSDWYEDKNNPTIIAGDFNFDPFSNEFEYARKNMHVSDAWAENHSSSEPGYTYDCYENHYAHDYTIKTHGSLFKDRIDYFFLRGNVKSLETTIKMNDSETTLSDHYGIYGEFEI
jgi:endonuclease/exonuclease/phosphatase family metal-dependent hydrolase